MKKIKTHLIIAIFPLLFLSFAYKNLTNCEKIKNGKFYYYAKKTREKINIERFDSLQLETNTKTGGSPIKSKIVWKTACKYDMFINALSESGLTRVDSIIAVTPSHVEIIFIGNAFYVCIAKMNIFNKNLEFRDTIYFKT